MHATLASRLGYRTDERLLIVNCDDVGSSHAANVATLQAMTQGVATSGTLMVPCPWAPCVARPATQPLVGWNRKAGSAATDRRRQHEPSRPCLISP